MEKPNDQDRTILDAAYRFYDGRTDLAYMRFACSGGVVYAIVGNEFIDGKSRYVNLCETQTPEELLAQLNAPFGDSCPPKSGVG